MDVKNIIVCPKCRCSLDDKLCCKECNTQYSKYYDVYDIVNPELSSNQEILWNITDEDLANQTNTNERQSIEDDWTKDYFSRKNKETIIAEQKLAHKTMELLNLRYPLSVQIYQKEF